MRRHSFNRPTQRSIRLRSRYAARSNSSGRASSLRCAITGAMPRSRRNWRTQPAEYPLSPANLAGRQAVPLASRNSGRCSTREMTCWVSCSWPGPTSTLRGRPWPSQTRWNLVLKPPRLRPRAWSGRSPAGIFFPSPGRSLVGADDAAVDEEQVPVDPAVGLALGLQVLQELLPQAVAGPLAEAVVDGRPRAEALGEVAPGGAGGQDPEDAVEQEAVVFPLAPAPAVLGKQMRNLFPLLVR